MKIRKNKIFNKGFTLIELLVVIAIITLLSGVVMASVTEARNKASNTKQLADYRSITAALLQFKQDKGYYPATDSDTCIGIYNSGGCKSFGVFISANNQANTEVQKYLSSLTFLEKTVLYTQGPPIPIKEYSGFVLKCKDSANYGECKDVFVKFPALKTNNSCPTILTDVEAIGLTTITDYTICSINLK